MEYIQFKNWQPYSIKSDITSPNVFYRIADKLGKVSEVMMKISCLNRVEYRNCHVYFTPKLMLKETTDIVRYGNSATWVTEMALRAVGFTTDTIDNVYNPKSIFKTVRIDLKNHKNAEIMQRNGYMFLFYRVRPLTQEILNRFSYQK